MQEDQPLCRAMHIRNAPTITIQHATKKATKTTQDNNKDKTNWHQSKRYKKWETKTKKKQWTHKIQRKKQ